jgi:ATP-dependent protease HslVU (ClpYQ) peptidase subunit
MTIIIAARTNDSSVVFGSDSRVSMDDGQCFNQPTPKYSVVYSGVVGIAGDVGHEAYLTDFLQKNKDVTIQDAIRVVSKELENELDVETIYYDRHLLWLVDGNTATMGPFEYCAIGNPAGIARAVLDVTIPKNPGKRTPSMITRCITKALRACAKYDTSVGAPFFYDVY